jgi:hypothetical protein
MAEVSNNASAPAPANEPLTNRDPILLVLVIALIVLYVAGQWLMFSALDAKLAAIQADVNNGTTSLETKIIRVEESVNDIRKIIKRAGEAAAKAKAEAAEEAKAEEAKAEEAKAEGAQPAEAKADAPLAPAPAPAKAPAAPKAPAAAPEK